MACESPSSFELQASTSTKGRPLFVITGASVLPFSPSIAEPKGKTATTDSHGHGQSWPRGLFISGCSGPLSQVVEWQRNGAGTLRLAMT